MAENQESKVVKAEIGTFTISFYRKVLENVIAGNVCSLTVSNGDNERVFFFTRGAILFLAVSARGRGLLAALLLRFGIFQRNKFGVGGLRHDGFGDRHHRSGVDRLRNEKAGDEADRVENRGEEQQVGCEPIEKA